jgi:alkylation response protein AidB-like acyl-CoA dehydrogenase
MEVTVDAVQVYGGYGFVKDYSVEKLMRDARSCSSTRAPRRSNAW